MRLRGKQKLQTVVLVLFITAYAYASASGPEPGYTGAPGDLGNCTACHDTFHDPNIGPGSVRVEGDVINNGYQPGQQYTLRVTVQQGGRRKFGFQLTALTLNNVRAGTLASLDSSTKVLDETGAGGRQYIEHAEGGTSGPGGSKTWQVRWTAPSTDVGPVRFYVAGNAANDNEENSGDYIYTTFASADSPSSVVTLQLESSPGGQILEAGSKVNINWSVTGEDYIDNIEARYSTDDGNTFPIANQIFFTTDASVDGFEWTVPNVATERARVRVTVGKKSGAEITPVLSDRFTIVVTGGGGPTLPEIVSVSISGKKLKVNGANFKEGAALYMCSGCAEPVVDGSKVKKVSFSEDPPTTTLTAKKAGNTIAPGSTVVLQVQNPDGFLSSPFTYTRPLE